MAPKQKAGAKGGKGRGRGRGKGKGKGKINKKTARGGKKTLGQSMRKRASFVLRGKGGAQSNVEEQHEQQEEVQESALLRLASAGKLVDLDRYNEELKKLESKRGQRRSADGTWGQVDKKLKEELKQWIYRVPQLLGM